MIDSIVNLSIRFPLQLYVYLLIWIWTTSFFFEQRLSFGKVSVQKPDMMLQMFFAPPFFHKKLIAFLFFAFHQKVRINLGCWCTHWEKLNLFAMQISWSLWKFSKLCRLKVTFFWCHIQKRMKKLKNSIILTSG